MSAKLGTGVNYLLNSLIDQVPSPSGCVEGPLRMLLFDSWYDQYRGVVCLVTIVDGSIQRGQYMIRYIVNLDTIIGDVVCSSHTERKYEVAELGIRKPVQVPQTTL